MPAKNAHLFQRRTFLYRMFSFVCFKFSHFLFLLQIDLDGCLMVIKAHRVENDILQAHLLSVCVSIRLHTLSPQTLSHIQRLSTFTFFFSKTFIINLSHFDFPSYYTYFIPCKCNFKFSGCNFFPTSLINEHPKFEPATQLYSMNYIMT